MKIGILVFDEMTQLDATGPFETFARLPGAKPSSRRIEHDGKFQLMIQYDPKPPFHAGPRRGKIAALAQGIPPVAPLRPPP